MELEEANSSIDSPIQSHQFFADCNFLTNKSKIINTKVLYTGTIWLGDLTRLSGRLRNSIVPAVD